MTSPPPVFHTFWFTQIEILPEYYRDAINVSVEILIVFTERNIFITPLSLLCNCLKAALVLAKVVEVPPPPTGPSSRPEDVMRPRLWTEVWLT